MDILYVILAALLLLIVVAAIFFPERLQAFRGEVGLHLHDKKWGFYCKPDLQTMISEIATSTTDTNPDHAAALAQGLAVYRAQDYPKALNLWRPLAEQGDLDAQTLLGTMYYEGHGVQRDYGQAAAWLRKAAVQGHAMAQGGLGAMYVLGQGVPQNGEEAYVWFSLAAAQGYEDATKGRDVAARLLTPDALSRAQARAAAEHARIHKAQQD
jgi:hypothetical protein